MIKKVIPPEMEKVVSEVLTAYPELENIEIHFLLKKTHPVPYGTVPAPVSFFRAPKDRVYRISIRTEAPPPEEAVLFKNLTFSQQKGVIAHELVHVLQFQKCSRLKMFRYLFSYPSKSFEKKLERLADRGTIERGFGKELYDHAVYIRNVPGYQELRPAINENYMQPREILTVLEDRGEIPRDVYPGDRSA
jgi:hypothetical protein